jgi:hypothetical protein
MANSASSTSGRMQRWSGDIYSWSGQSDFDTHCAFSGLLDTSAGRLVSRKIEVQSWSNILPNVRHERRRKSLEGIHAWQLHIFSSRSVIDSRFVADRSSILSPA